MIGDVVITQYTKPVLEVQDTCSLYEASGSTFGRSDLDSKAEVVKFVVNGESASTKVSARVAKLCSRRRRRGRHARPARKMSSAGSAEIFVRPLRFMEIVVQPLRCIEMFVRPLRFMEVFARPLRFIEILLRPLRFVEIFARPLSFMEIFVRPLRFMEI